MKKAAQKNKRRRKRGARRRGGSEPKVVKSAMRVVHPVCCGIDVHKDVIVCTIARSAEGTLAAEYEQRSFSTRWGDLVDCRTWLGDSGCVDVCMESTGKYWVPVYNVLSATCNVVVANPKYTRAIQGKKTDSKDATWIADLFRLGMVTASFIPPQVPILISVCAPHFISSSAAMAADAPPMPVEHTVTFSPQRVPV